MISSVVIDIEMRPAFTKGVRARAGACVRKHEFFAGALTLIERTFHSVILNAAADVTRRLRTVCSVQCAVRPDAPADAYPGRVAGGINARVRVSTACQPLLGVYEMQFVPGARVCVLRVRALVYSN